MTLKKDILTSIIGIVVLTLALGIVYPLFITGVSQVAFPGNANGQQVHVGGKLVASKIIGQSFADPVINKRTGKPKLDANGNPVTTPDPHYFQTRPSATVPADNAAATDVLQPRPQRHRHQGRDPGQHPGLPRPGEAV